VGALAFVIPSFCPMAWLGLEADSLMRVNEEPLEPDLEPLGTVGLLEPEVKAREFLMARKGVTQVRAPSLDPLSLLLPTSTSHSHPHPHTAPQM
jgi:hypothetical protein